MTATVSSVGARIARLCSALAPLVVLAILAPGSPAAASVVGVPGEGAGQTAGAAGVAVDTSSGRLYIADAGNNRIDAFDAASGTFEMAFGWGVKDGSAELQSCGPAATPPSGTCRKGLGGGGAGELESPQSVAVDNDPASASHQDIYVFSSFRVEKFDPAGEFLLAWGGGVVTGGATGTGNLLPGSPVVNSVATTSKAFEVGQTITGPGIPANTRIAAVDSGTITLSKPATAVGNKVALNVAVGPGNVPINERQVLIQAENGGQYQLEFTTPKPSPTQATTGLIGINATAAEVQSELEALPSIGSGNVGVAGPSGGPYTIEFKGPRFADTDVNRLQAPGLGNRAILTGQNGGSGAELCPAASADFCAAGVAGGGEGQFGTGTEPLAIGPGGAIYAGDTFQVAEALAAAPIEFAKRVEEFGPSGAYTGQIDLPQDRISEVSGVAVNSAGDVFAAVESGGPEVHEFDSSGNPLATFGPSQSVNRLAVDPLDNLFLGHLKTIEEYDSSGGEVSVFGYGDLSLVNLLGLAPFQSANGEIFVVEQQNGSTANPVLYLSFPPPGPIVLPEPGLTNASPVGNTKATLNMQVNPEGKATKYHFEYITDADFQTNLAEGHPGFTGATRAPASAGDDPVAGSDFALHELNTQVGCSEPTEQLIAEGKCLVPETKYRFRAFAENLDGQSSPVEGEPFTTKEPIELGESWSSEVGTESAVLNTELNPLGIAATGHFQYIAEGPDFEANGFAHATETPSLDFGSGEVATARAARIETLQPHTTYHYRIVAADFFLAEKDGPDQTFRTFAPSSGTLPDGRTYELVSPTAKNGGEVGVPTPAGGAAEKSAQPQQSSPSGEEIAYGSFTAFGENPESAPASSEYRSVRGPGGWSTENLNPRFEEGYTRDPFVGFSSDLSRAAVVAIEPPLTEDATKGFSDIYSRDNGSGVLTTITTEGHGPGIAVPKFEYCITYGGASANFDHVVFSALGALNQGDPVAKGFNLYEWSATDGVQLVSRLPGSNAPASPQIDTGFGALTGDLFCNAETKLLRHAISADGSRIFWTLSGTFQGAQDPLFARVDGAGGKETLRLDKPNQGIAGAGGGGEYWDASADGAEVFFTDTGKLTADATASGTPDLYRYDFEGLAGKRLTDLTAHPGEAADVQGVIGASEDGSFVYFVAKGALSADPNREGDTATAGEDNLYAWHDGETRFVATLTAADQSDWSTEPNEQSARVTPDGEHLAFLSTGRITGFDNTVSGNTACKLAKLGEGQLVESPRCAEVFLYGFNGGELACASCNPSNGRPIGPARVPGWSVPYEQPRYLSDDGSRLFFETLDGLDPRDTNGKRDVYEFERQGAGSCNAATSTFVPGASGCVFLISTGESDDESYLLDASSSGDDVFLSTRQKLVFTDGDERSDLYDARVGGNPPTPPPAACEGEGCRESGTVAPPAPAPGTSVFEGPGNPTPSRGCPKGTHAVRRNGKARCVKPAKPHKPKQRHGRGVAR
jgi:hypothetical protein